MPSTLKKNLASSNLVVGPQGVSYGDACTSAIASRAMRDSPVLPRVS
jgi:hypothetical protein